MPSTNDNTAAAQELRLKRDRACDACRRRKTKCDGPSMSNHVCTNCIQARKPCTYVEVSKPRGPPKAYITGLEDRLEGLEAILQQIRPGQDFSEQLGPAVVRGSWKSQDASNSSSNLSSRKSPIANNVLPPLLIPYHSKNDDPSQTSVITRPPRSTHLIFRSKPTTRRMRENQDPLSSSSGEFSDESSSSSEEPAEETVISSLAGREKITLFVSESDNSTEDDNIRFHGRSSTAGLIEITRQFKHMHMEDTIGLPQEEEKNTPPIPKNLTVAQWRRPAFWRRPKWEYSYESHRAESLEKLQVLLEYFPAPDLANDLINLYFRHSNIFFPLLHRPTFDRQWQQQLHRRNIWFSGVCLSIFAIASRWSNDTRVLPTTVSQESTDIKLSWRHAGRQYFDMVVEIHRIRESLLHPTSLFEVQTFTLMGMYLQSASDFPAGWIIISTGLRKTQDVGAHRKKVYRDEPNLDDELWKRAFWMLVILDRVGGVNLGRPCCISEEDFDLDFPLEIDDDFYDQDSKRFKQPQGMPSTLTAFVQAIKLTQIMAFSMRTLYAINKSKVYHGVAPVDQKLITKQLSLAMFEWLEHLPEHLRWKDNMDDPIFFAQSAGLSILYHLTQISIWRSLISAPISVFPSPQHEGNSAPSTPSISAPTDPAVIKCTEAARACAGIVKVQIIHGIDSFYVPGIINISHVCAGFFLLHAWSLKIQEKGLQQKDIRDMKLPLTNQIEQHVSEAKIFLQALEKVRDRWDIVDMLLNELNESLSGLEDPQTEYDAHEALILHNKQLTPSRSKSPLGARSQYPRQHEDTMAYSPSSASKGSYHSQSRYDRLSVASNTNPNSDPVINKLRTAPIAALEIHSFHHPLDNTSWHERPGHYISSIRTSLSDEQSQVQQSDAKYTQTEVSNTQSFQHSLNELPDRTENMITPFNDDSVYLTIPQYVHEQYRRDSTFVAPHASYERGNHRSNGWASTLTGARLQQPGEDE